MSVFKRHPKFRTAIIGAVAIAGFSILGGLSRVSPVTGPASASVDRPSATHARTPAAPVLVSLTPSPAAAKPKAVVKKPKAVVKKTAVLPRPAHIVIVLEENKSPKLLASHAPYIAALERHGANFTDAFAETHPSQPNYLALFSGGTRGITDDSCPHTFASKNLASQLLAAGRTFKGYAESMPSDGFTGCTSGTKYARKHTPWIDFANVPASDSLRFSRFPQGHFASLPTVSFVTPNLCNDMHDCSVATGDAWLKANLSAYASWAKTHNSLLIVTFDEAEDGVPNRIPLVMYGEPIVTGTYAYRVNHYSILRTIETMYGLPCLANSCDVKPITAVFTAS